MKAYQVQFVLPCEDPVNNVRMIRRKTTLVFELPINYPSCEQVGLAELMRVAKVTQLSPQFTGLNNTVEKPLKKKKLRHGDKYRLIKEEEPPRLPA